jgi:hypothetical protein
MKSNYGIMALQVKNIGIPSVVSLLKKAEDPYII